MTDRLLTQVAIAQTWQLAVLIVAVALVTRLLARNHPHLAYVLWLVVLAKCLTPPLWSSPTGVFSWLQAATDVVDDRPSPDVGTPRQQTTTCGAANYADTSAPRKADVAVSVRPVSPPQTIDTLKVLPTISAVPEPLSFSRLVLTAWLGGSLTVLLAGTLRWLACWWRWQHSTCEVDASLQRTLGALSRRLGLRRRVRLVITGGLVGPAVVGLWRPTIILPAAVAHGKTAADLEPILAHELLHVRRGDLWVGLVQVSAQALWWFHPLVWFANRMLSREAERACDEEVVAELGCSPARYARSLLDVLEQKQSLRAVPAFPGVRAVDITSQRLERIMRLGQGCRRRTPWWCWVVLLVLAVLTLPGARLLVAWEPPAEKNAYGSGKRLIVTDFVSQQQANPESRHEPRVRVSTDNELRDEPSTARSAPSPDELQARELVINERDLDDLLTSLERDTGFEGAEGRSFLLETIYNQLIARCMVDNDQDAAKRIQIAGVDDRHILFADSAGGTNDKPHGIWITAENTLLLRSSARDFARLQHVLQNIQKQGFRRIQIAARFAWGPAVAIDSVSADCTTLPIAIPSEEDGVHFGDAAHGKTSNRTRATGGALRPSRAIYSIEQELPLMVELLDDRRRDEVLDQLQNNRRTSLLQSPKVMLYGGQTASVADVTQTPFVVGVKPIVGKDAIALEPQIRVISSGCQFFVRPVLVGNIAHLDYELELSEIKEVKTQPIAVGKGAEAATVQVPVVARTRVESSVDVPLGKTLLLGGLKRLNDKGEEESFALILEVTLPPRENPKKESEPVRANDRDGAATPSSAEVAGLDASLLAQTANNRLAAATKNLEAVEAAYKKEDTTLDLLLDAQRRLADCELTAAQWRLRSETDRLMLGVSGDANVGPVGDINPDEQNNDSSRSSMNESATIPRPPPAWARNFRRSRVVGFTVRDARDD